MENQDYLDYRYGGVQFVVPKHFQMMKNMEDGYRTRAHASTEDLHVSRTLDQSYYTSLMTTQDRDYDQVIYRYTAQKTRIQRAIADNLRSHRGDTLSMSEDNDCASLFSAEGINPDHIKGKATPQLLMVNSIWIWKLGSKFQKLNQTALHNRNPNNNRHDHYSLSREVVHRPKFTPRPDITPPNYDVAR
jgi:hypothetical protein